MNSKHKLWGGRFTSETSSLLEHLNCSLNIDRRMYAEDILGSQKYANALYKINLLTEDELQSIHVGLETVRQQWENDTIEFQNGDEDVHTVNERLLKEHIGKPAMKLHVGRSRNDQVVTDMKLWLRSAMQKLESLMLDLIQVFTERAASELDVLMPGYTHLQRAQPIRWSHWLLSHAWNFKADLDRLKSLKPRCNILPLGSGALAGNPFNIDRIHLAKELGFDIVSQNSMQAVSDRDFVLEFLFWCSLTGLHLSRLAEDLIIYSTKEFSFVSIDDSFSTGSSLMPQKHNPDSLELIRGLSGTLCGELTGFMMTIKGLPTTYNKDLQSDKEHMFKANDRLTSMLNVAIGALRTLQLKPKNCKAALSYDMLATDVAYYLVRKGVAFREAHHLAGQVVSLSEEKHISMPELTINDYKTISDIFESDIFNIWNYENSVEQYKVIGGTSKQSVIRQIKFLEQYCNNINNS
ncbi:argininosuccinate lyase [Chrysoperla carnea]|uniref:argininosuccinate lyase n=1 Tax=Chrysoperla carnea TaxID=189513 RepID=UPI001D07D1F6|nr:argininosuccinate lyase [Chrysoperla carnea]